MKQSGLALPWGRIALAGATTGIVLLTLILPCEAQSPPAALTAIRVAPEGKLVRVTLEATVALESFALSRQGPPEKRDLVLVVRGMVSGLSATPTDVSGPEPIVPYELTAIEDKGIPTVKIVFQRGGDALVRVDHEGGKLSLLLIPPEPRRTTMAGAYRIGGDDVLAISVFGHDDLTKTTKVSPDGLINFPLIGNVTAAGRTVDEISTEIRDRLAKDFLVDPHVTVSVWEYLSQWVNVIGEIAKPGRYYLTGPTTLIDAISEAGGLRPTAGATILVTRRVQESDPADAGEVLRFSTASLLSEEKAATVIRLRSGDVVNALAREVFYVAGDVRNPGAYPLDRATTLTKAITIAGGLSSGAGGAGIELIRDEGGAQERTSYTLRDIEDRKTPDPPLHPGDVVVVKPKS